MNPDISRYGVAVGHLSSVEAFSAPVQFDQLEMHFC